MTGNLEYLMSSLPNLSFQNTEETQLQVTSLFKKYAGIADTDNNPIVNLNKEADKFLSQSESEFFQEINLDTIYNSAFQKSKNKLVEAFSVYTFSLKKNVEQLRMFRKNTENQVLSSKQLLSITPGNPLEEEVQLIKFQWDKLESLSIGHYADFEALIIYKLQLMLLLRWWSFNSDKGFSVFEKTIKTEVHG